MKSELTTMPKAENGFVPTLNKTGFMTTALDPFSKAFVDFSASLGPDQTALEIGTAYGVASLEVLKHNVKLVCNDLDPRHLKILKYNADNSHLSTSKLECLPGDFLSILSDSKYHGRFNSILCCRVLHFLDPNAIELAFQLFSRILSRKGRLFVVNETCYLKNFQAFIPTYEKRLLLSPHFAGYVDDVQAIAPDRGQNLPRKMTFFDRATFTHLSQLSNLNVVQCSTFARKEFPIDLQLDGRESIGLIAEKT